MTMHFPKSTSSESIPSVGNRGTLEEFQRSSPAPSGANAGPDDTSSERLQDLFARGMAILAEAVDTPDALQAVLTLLIERTSLKGAAVYSLQGTTQKLVCLAACGPVASELAPRLSLDGSNAIARAVKARKAIYAPSVSDPSPSTGAVSSMTQYVVPLALGSRVYGALSAYGGVTEGMEKAGTDLINPFARLAALTLERRGLGRERRKERASRTQRTSSGIALLHPDGTIQEVNPTFAELLAYQAHEIRGKKIIEVVANADQPKILRAAKRARQRELRPLRFLNRHVGKSGETIPCMTSFDAIGRAETDADHLLLTLNRAQAKKTIEEPGNAISSAQVHTQGIRTLGMLASGVAHDFNNVLEVILGFASLARMRLTQDDPLQEPLKIIEESAGNAAMLVQQLLEVTKDDPADREPLDPSTI